MAMIRRNGKLGCGYVKLHRIVTRSDGVDYGTGFELRRCRAAPWRETAQGALVSAAHYIGRS